MSVITANTIMNFSYDQVPRFLKNFKLRPVQEKIAITIYNSLKNTVENKIHKYIDMHGHAYCGMSRQTLANTVGVSVKTIITHIQHLVRIGLLIDRRLGLGKTNRIYFILPTDMNENETYHKESIEENHELAEEIKESNEEPSKRQKIISMAKEMIAEVTDKKLSNKQVRGLLYKIDWNIDEFEKINRFMAGKTFTNGYCAYFNWAVHSGKYKEKPVPPKARSKPTPQHYSKPSKFVNFKGREWDFEKLEQLEQLKISISLGKATKEEQILYNTLIKDLGWDFSNDSTKDKKSTKS